MSTYGPFGSLTKRSYDSLYAPAPSESSSPQRGAPLNCVLQPRLSPPPSSGVSPPRSCTRQSPPPARLKPATPRWTPAKRPSILGKYHLSSGCTAMERNFTVREK